MLYFGVHPRVLQPVILEEWGKWLNASANATLEERSRFMAAAFADIKELMLQPGSALQGSLFWQWYLEGQEGALNKSRHLVVFCAHFGSRGADPLRRRRAPPPCPLQARPPRAAVAACSASTSPTRRSPSSRRTTPSSPPSTLQSRAASPPKVPAWGLWTSARPPGSTARRAPGEKGRVVSARVGMPIASGEGHARLAHSSVGSAAAAALLTSPRPRPPAAGWRAPIATLR